MLDLPEVRPYYNRIVGERNSEAACVGLQAVRGMKMLVEKVVKKGSGGRSKHGLMRWCQDDDDVSCGPRRR